MIDLQADIIVVGAGPAGISAAIAAAEANADVLVVDAQRKLGGQIWRQGLAAAPKAAKPYLRRFKQLEIRTLSRAEVSVADPAIREGDKHRIGGKCQDASFQAQASKLILATGAMERPVPFPGWTMPGVVAAGGLQALVKGGLDVSDSRIVVAGSGPLLLAVAHSLRDAGAEIVALADTASRLEWMKLGVRICAHPRKLSQATRLSASLRSVPRHYRSWPVRAEGSHSLERVTLETPKGQQVLECDYLANGFGLVPSLSLAQLLGCRVEPIKDREGAAIAHRVSVDELLRTSVAGIWCAGEGSGIGGVDVALLEGSIAGLAAGGDTSSAQRKLGRIRRERRFAQAIERISTPPSLLRALPDEDTIICRCEDISYAQLSSAALAQNAHTTLSVHSHVRDIKLKTRCGMGLCQGRVCGTILSFLMHAPPMTPRPPLYPLSSDELAALCKQV